ncbi:glycosyltransferase family 2 protein [Larkinella rosea]|uniref:Glycosyltransferase family 2 protein n=1 Tax=Larkinella rosea TaxID=2025312 RepID=A0A3P1BIB3_9BACT|nr:glycosyltransferase family 2 protein [Larkinella rosea]RRB00715.1 glycosyltransferase family 2 protein [Larkinella rosea]
MKLSVIILNYNSSGYTLDCIASIRKQTQLADYEIVVVDNGSHPGDFDRLYSLTQQPFVKVVRSRVNLGFAGGHLLGLQAIDPSSAYYFFLNNDCQLLDDVCSRLYGFMEENRSVGVCTGQAVNRTDEHEPSFNHFPTLSGKLLGRGVMQWFKPADYLSRRRTFEKPTEVPVITGSALFVRAAAFWQVGGFDPAFFLYCEEEDLCWRMRERSWKAMLIPDVRFRHLGGGSTRRNLQIEKEYYISLFYYFRKNENVFKQLLLQLFYTVKVGRKAVKSNHFAQLAWFILRGAPGRESLRYRQGLAVLSNQLIEHHQPTRSLLPL